MMPLFVSFVALLAASDAPGQLNISPHYIAAPSPRQDRSTWLRALRAYREHVRSGTLGGAPGLSLYDRPEMAWAASAFTCHFTFMYDRGFYDPESGEYTVDALLDDGQREFGGYDILVLWQGYPRLGADDRNQFDMYCDMPGGLAGIREVVRRAHRRGVRVFIDYNPWDTGTRREARSDEEALAELVKAIDADGIFLDTMSAASGELRRKLDAVRPGIVLAPEIHPPVEQIGLLNMSWAQWLTDPAPPGLLHLKWIEPRHMQHQVRRWDASHRAEIEAAFFNGSGMLVWENVFGSYNPWSGEDRALWKRASRILRFFGKHLASEAWEPFVPTLRPGLFAHRWPSPGGSAAALWTIRNTAEPLKQAALIEADAVEGAAWIDLWNACPAPIEPAGPGRVRVIASCDSLGCIARVPAERAETILRELQAPTSQPREGEDGRHRRREAPATLASPAPPPVAAGLRTGRDLPVGDNVAAAPRGGRPPGMVRVPGGTYRFRVEHVRRECGCYPDPGTPKERWGEFLLGSDFQGILKHDSGDMKVSSFFIDEAEVSNAEFKQFLDETGYRPRHAEAFLRHWPDGRLPPELAEHPVVYVDIDDARAYARWAGKRLPTEWEWQLAAQGTDGRAWPWGKEFDAARCNGSGGRTMPVRSLPEGRSPCGCFHMSGNVWEWTESCHDDGHTRFCMIRGGSAFRAEGSHWYMDGGAQPCHHHAKFIRMWPGLDRCSTIGFRCVVDAQE